MATCGRHQSCAHAALVDLAGAAASVSSVYIRPARGDATRRACDFDDTVPGTPPQKPSIARGGRAARLRRRIVSSDRPASQPLPGRSIHVVDRLGSGVPCRRRANLDQSLRAPTEEVVAFAGVVSRAVGRQEGPEALFPPPEGSGPFSGATSPRTIWQGSDASAVRLPLRDGWEFWAGDIAKRRQANARRDAGQDRPA